MSKIVNKHNKDNKHNKYNKDNKYKDIYLTMPVGVR